jgi:predicted Zn-dependent peptidase
LATDIENSREFLKKNYGNVLENNSGWMSAITRWYDEGYNYKENYLPLVESITYEDVQALAQKILEDNNYAKVIMRPAK